MPRNWNTLSFSAAVGGIEQCSYDAFRRYLMPGGEASVFARGLAYRRESNPSESRLSAFKSIHPRRLVWLLSRSLRDVRWYSLFSLQPRTFVKIVRRVSSFAICVPWKTVQVNRDTVAVCDLIKDQKFQSTIHNIETEFPYFSVFYEKKWCTEMDFLIKNPTSRDMDNV